MQYEFVNEFDAVFMLTWSDWATEQRSNRYHFATRFAQKMPVFFFQHIKNNKNKKITVELSECRQVEIIQMPHELSKSVIDDIKKFIYIRGIKKPLIWIYDPLYYISLLDSLPTGYRVFHATEDYFTDTKHWDGSIQVIRRSLKDLLGKVDLLVACSNGVAASYVANGNYHGQLLVSKNGCDAEFYIDLMQSTSYEGGNKPIAIYQGGINSRIDFELLKSLIKRMPDWEFHFCGKTIDDGGWKSILNLPNVRYFGVLNADEVAKLMIASTAGIIPFKQDPWIKTSLPLKAYEYVACGLPVVTVPIDELEKNNKIFSTAATLDEFEKKLHETIETRIDIDLLESRKISALDNAYSKAFELVTSDLLAEKKKRVNEFKSMNVALIYDFKTCSEEESMKEHVLSFIRFSRHSISLICATKKNDDFTSLNEAKFDLSLFDVVIIDYSASDITVISKKMIDSLEKFNGLKILLLRNVEACIERLRSSMENLRISMVYSSCTDLELEKDFPSFRFPATDFLFIPDPYIANLTKNKLNSLGIDKRRSIFIYSKDDLDCSITRKFKELLGSSDFTFNSKLQASARVAFFLPEDNNSPTSALNFSEDFDSVILKNPNIYHAIKSFTPLILIEGDALTSVFSSDQYILLKNNFSNILEVLQKINNDDYLSQIAVAAYECNIVTRKYSSTSFIKAIDFEISSRMMYKISKGFAGTGLDYFFNGMHQNFGDNSKKIIETHSHIIQSNFKLYKIFKNKITKLKFIIIKNIFKLIHVPLARQFIFKLISFLPKNFLDLIIKFYLKNKNNYLTK
jgi:glycosyltransferase involved in cell wall biosynthesis